MSSNDLKAFVLEEVPQIIQKIAFTLFLIVNCNGINTLKAFTVSLCQANKELISISKLLDVAWEEKKKEMKIQNVYP